MKQETQQLLDKAQRALEAAQTLLDHGDADFYLLYAPKSKCGAMRLTSGNPEVIKTAHRLRPSLKNKPVLS